MGLSELKRSSQLLEETEHFRRWRQQEVAKIVPLWGANPTSVAITKKQFGG
jgi:hypothetical protein